MLKIHEMKWSDCLSHQIWPYVRKGWKANDKDVNFFWGLGGANVQKIQQCIDWGLEW